MSEILIDKFKDKISQIDNRSAYLVDNDSWKDVSEFIKNDKKHAL